MLPTVIYTRVSSDEQKNNFSLDSQVGACREYCTKNAYSLHDEVFREDYTGTELDRPELDKIRALASEGKIERLVCLEIDRLGRGQTVPLVIEKEFEKLGVKVEYVQETYEDTPEGALRKGLRVTITEFERLQILSRTKRGRTQKLKSGKVNVAKIAKYGYAVQGKKHDTVYVIAPDEAKVIKDIYEWFAGRGDETGKHLKRNDIARRLTALAVPTRLDKLGGKFAARKRARAGAWGARMILKILRDETYAGTAYYRVGRGHCCPLPPSEWHVKAFPLCRSSLSNAPCGTRLHNS